MRKESTATGRTVEEAIEKAKDSLGEVTGEISFEILELPRKGFLGFGKSPAKVRVYVNESEPVIQADPPKIQENVEDQPLRGEPERENTTAELAPKSVVKKAEKTFRKPEKNKPAEPEESGKGLKEGLSKELSPKAAAAVDYVSDILSHMGVKNARVKAKESKDGVDLTLEGEGLGVIIGRRGETLDAVQYLTSLVINRMEGDYLRVSIDSGDYRKKRVETLERLAFKIARNVVKTGRSTKLEPMNPYERRIIHAAVAKVEGAASASIGEEPNRRVVISPKDSKRNQESYYRREAAPQGRRDRRPPRPRPPAGKKPPADPIRDAEIEIPEDLAPGERTVPPPAQVKSKETHAVTEEEKDALPLYGKLEI